MMGRRGVEESSLGIVSRDCPGQSHQFQLTRHELPALLDRRAGYALPRQRFRAELPPVLSRPTFLRTAKPRASTALPRPPSRKPPLHGLRDNQRHGRPVGEASPTLWQSSPCRLSLWSPCLKAKRRENLPLSPSMCPRTLVTLRLYQVLLSHLHSKHLRLIGKSFRMIFHHKPTQMLRTYPYLRARLSTALIGSPTLSLVVMDSRHLMT